MLAAAAVALANSQDFTEVRIDRALSAHYRFLNGPAWSKDGFLVFSDVPANQVIRWTPGQKPEVVLEDAQGAAGQAIDAQGRIWVCLSRGRRVIRVDKNKRVQVVAEGFQGKKFNAPNDIAVRKDGVAFFTDPAFGYQQDNRELDFYGVYRVSAKGELELAAKWTTRPNGLALSANGRLLYVSDSDRREVRVFDVDRNGAATNERVFVKGFPGVPRGLCTDEKGNVYLAAKYLEIYSPEGKLVRTVEMSATPSGCTVGEADMQSVMVTAGPVVYRIRGDVKGSPQAPRSRPE